MAKQAKKTADNVIEVPQQEQTVNVNTVNAPTVAKKETVQKNLDWEIKDRLYTLKSGKKPLTYTLQSKHSSRKPLLWFDPEKGYQRELRYSTNQRSPLSDEQVGLVTLGRIMFKGGALRVPKEDVCLQKLLSLYHPGKDSIYEEYNPVQVSINETAQIELEIEALLIAKQMDINEAEAVLRVEQGSAVDKLSSSELKRDLLIFAKRNPALFIELANDDNVELRNIGIKATQAGIIQLSKDQRTFTYGDNQRKLMTVPFDEHPYSALAAWFKTDEGMEVLNHITKKM
jgi:hypothetical protein